VYSTEKKSCGKGGRSLKKDDLAISSGRGGGGVKGEKLLCFNPWKRERGKGRGGGKKGKLLFSRTIQAYSKRGKQGGEG